jgi:hypothetical protein
LGGVENPLFDLAGLVAGRAAPAGAAALGRSAFGRRRQLKTLSSPSRDRAEAARRPPLT